MKKQIKIADQKAEDRKRKKEEIKKSSATKPKRLGKHQYPTVRRVVCTLHPHLKKEIMGSASKEVLAISIANK